MYVCIHVYVYALVRVRRNVSRSPVFNNCETFCTFFRFSRFPLRRDQSRLAQSGSIRSPRPGASSINVCHYGILFRGIAILGWYVHFLRQFNQFSADATHFWYSNCKRDKSPLMVFQFDHFDFPYAL